MSAIRTLLGVGLLHLAGWAIDGRRGRDMVVEAVTRQIDREEYQAMLNAMGSDASMDE